MSQNRSSYNKNTTLLLMKMEKMLLAEKISKKEQMTEKFYNYLLTTGEKIIVAIEFQPKSKRNYIDISNVEYKPKYIQLDASPTEAALEVTRELYEQKGQGKIYKYPVKK